MNIKDFVARNKWVLALFLLSTAFFTAHHALNPSWDFSAYVLNAKYWFSSGEYFELLRPPLVPFLLGIFAVFGWKASEYIFIVFVSAFFAYSCAKLAKSAGIRKELLYAFLLSPFVLWYGMMAGTELLSLALLQMAAASLLAKRNSGIWLGLACLTRYNLVIFLPLLIFHRNLRDILKNVVLFAIPFVPWFAYNYAAFGNIFASIADSYAMNFLLRSHYVSEPLSFMHFLAAINILAPFLVLGLLVVFRQKPKWFWTMSAMAVLGMINYAVTPLKFSRYLFVLALPAAFFAARGASHIADYASGDKKRTIRIITAVFVGISFSAAFVMLARAEERENLGVYGSAVQHLDKIGLGSCAVQSNGWIFMNHLGRTTEPSPPKDMLDYYLSQNRAMVFFKHISEPDYVRDKNLMQALPVVVETNEYIIIGNASSCAPIEKVDESYVEWTARNALIGRRMRVPTDACEILFGNNTLGRFCSIAGRPENN